jgi:ABC-type transport system substrate-binding protein
MAALADGQCDLLLQDAIPGTPNAAMLALIRDGAARLYLDPQPTFEHLVFNLSPADPFAPAFFSDPAVRKAAALCVDRGAIVQAVYNGLVPPLDQSLPEDHPLLLGAPSGMYPFDPRTGAMLLEGLGWIDGNGDGVREAQAVPGFTDGQPLSITLAIPDSTLRVDSGELISGQLRACGFQVNLVQAPGRDLLAQSQEALIAGRRFDLAEMSSALGVEALCALGGSTEIAGPTNSWSGRNLSGYSDPAFDASCRALDNSLPGTPEYITIRQTVIFLFYRAIPDLPLFVRTNFTLARPDLAGISSGLGQNELQQIEEFRWEP